MNTHPKKGTGQRWAAPVVLGLILACTPPAWAMTRPTPPPPLSTATACEYYGRIGAFAAAMRSQGVSSHFVLDYLRQEVLAKVVGTPGGTPAGFERLENHITAYVLAVYALPDLGSDQAKLVVYQACMQEHGQ